MSITTGLSETNRSRLKDIESPHDCASEGTSAFGVSSAIGAAVAELAPLAGAFMPLAIRKACVEELLTSSERDANGGS